jgi:LPS O-antigen subunit length determinant protein (WzzB/FepE family)
MNQEEKITKEQEKAIKQLNSALKNAHKHNVFLAGVDQNLYFATIQSINVCTNIDDYCDVARCAQHNDDGSGMLYSGNYQDSGGW